MKVINLGATSSAINCYIAQLRDVTVQGDRTRFRNNIRRIGSLMAYELSKTLSYSPKTVTTPLAEAPVSTYDDRVVIGTVLRAGLSLHEGFLNVFDGADAGFVAAYREEDTPGDINIHLDYIACPSLSGSTFLLVEPMLATGKSFETAYRAFTTHGVPARLHLCAVIASQQGVDYLKSIFPSDDVTLWVAALDPALNDKAYIVPGLGDAGDLCFGEKL